MSRFGSSATLRLKERLQAGEVVFGTWVMGSRHPSLIRLIAGAGFDYVILDTQHVALSEGTLEDLLDVAGAVELPAFVRVIEVSFAAVNHLLDLGASGVVCPDVRDRSNIVEAVAGMRFPPRGRRSAMGVAPGLGFRTPTNRGDLARLEAMAMLVVQIESSQAVADIRSFGDSDEIDVLDVGRGDLAIDCGTVGDSRSSAVVAAVDEVVQVGRELGIPVGSTCTSAEDAADLAGRGIRWLTYSSDRRILEVAYREGLRAIRGRLV